MEKIQISEYMHRFDALWRETLVLYENWAKKYGLSYCELLTWVSLSQSNTLPCTQKSICDRWRIAKQTVNGILSGLLKKGYVTLIVEENDRRNKRIKLTESGKELILPVAEKLRMHESKVWEKMGSKEAETLLNTSALYNKLFEEVDIT